MSRSRSRSSGLAAPARNSRQGAAKQPRVPSFLAALIGGKAAGNAPEPTTIFLARLKLGLLSIGHQEDLLGQVVHPIHLNAQRPDERPQPGLMFTDQGAEGISVCRPGFSRGPLVMSNLRVHMLILSRARRV